MIDFDTAVAKHGEVIVQAILEDWERFNKISPSGLMTLEQRWSFFWNSAQALAA